MSLIGDKLKTKNSTLGKKLNPNKKYSEQTLRVINSIDKEKTNNASTTQQKMDALWEEEKQITEHGGSGKSFANTPKVTEEQTKDTKMSLPCRRKNLLNHWSNMGFSVF